ncbi:MAG: NADH-quinone oxidoreductase subunit J [Elusimicrobia bacterium]|nr:NADH-quinone oxidoreductase subunit J [Elusimicrobiota bacterium]
MIVDAIAFYSMAAVAVTGAVLVVTLRNAVHSALALGLSLAGVAGIFAALGADFLFAAQLLIYVGAIAVLIVFVLMLLGRASDLRLRQVNQQWAAALLICAITGVGLFHLAKLFGGIGAAAASRPTTRPLGLLMLGDYVLCFELVSLVLLAALLGAIFFSHKDAP